MDVAVVGAGAVGATAARELAERGAAVTLYDRGEVGGGSTGLAAGVCYDAFAGRTDADMARESLAAFRDLDGRGGFGFADRPYVWLARAGDDRRADAIRDQVPRMQAAGSAAELVDPATLAREFPALRTRDVAVAAVTREAGACEPAAYAGLQARLAREAGATVREGRPVALDDGDVRTPEGRAAVETVVVAAGAHSAAVLAEAGHPIPVKPYRVQAAVTAATPAGGDLPMLHDATCGFYLRPRSGGLLVGDGTEPVERDPDEWDRNADDWFVADCADHLATALGTALPVERAWAGLCTATPDGDPLVGEVAPGIVVATGWQGHGFMRAPATGRLVADCVLDGADSPFDPARFDGDEEFQIVEGMALERPAG